MPISVAFGKPRTASGLRNKRITIQTMTPSKGGTSYPIETPSTLATVYASRRDIMGDESFRSNQQEAWAQTQWTIAYRQDMDPEFVDVTRIRRIVFAGHVFNIQAATVLDGKIGIELITMATVD